MQAAVPSASRARRIAGTRADALRDALAEAILRGELCPGQRLDEASLAERYAVSRTPVREALKQLAATELILLRPHRGAVVADLPPARMGELFEALGEIEAACARLAAVKMSTLERERLEELHAACARAMAEGGREPIDATNRAFHGAIHDGSHNAYLAQAAHGLRRRMAPFSRAQFALEGRPDRSASEHAAIMTALRARDGAATEAAMRRHVASVGRAYLLWATGGLTRPEG